MVFTPKRCSNPYIELSLTAPLKTALSEISSSDGISLILFFVHQCKLLHPPFESQPPPEATNKNTAPPLMGKLPRRIAQAIRPQTERLNTISAQRWLFSIPLFSHIHFKKSVVPKVYISTFISFLLSMFSSFLLSRPVNNVVFAKFHALKTRGVKKI